MLELKTTPTPDLPKPTVQKAEVKKPTYGIQTSYTRKWGKSSYTKPAVKAYSVPSYKPINYSPKKYTPKYVSYNRPEPKVEEVEKKAEEVADKRAETIARSRKSYSSYDTDDKRYLRTYHNRYSGTPTKSHSHMSCLQRMMSKFSKYNSVVRSRRQARNASLYQRK